MTVGPINLNKVRKARARQEAETRADRNAVKHGRKKADRAVETACGERIRALLEAHRLTDGK